MLFLLKQAIKKLFLLTSLLYIIACSHSPTTIMLQPELAVNEKSRSLQSNLTWHMRSQDQRIAHYLIEISRGDDVATLINESKSSRMQIENSVRKQWLAQGLNFASDSQYKVDLKIVKLLAQVKQNSLSFDLNSNIIIRVKLSSNSKTFTKTFTAHLSEETLFNASVSKVAEQLNAQLSQLLTEIVQDPELTDKLQQL